MREYLPFLILPLAFLGLMKINETTETSSETTTTGNPNNPESEKTTPYKYSEGKDIGTWEYGISRIFDTSIMITGTENEALKDMEMDAEPIAKEIGTTPSNVKKWIEEMHKWIYEKEGTTSPEKSRIVNPKDTIEDYCEDIAGRIEARQYTNAKRVYLQFKKEYPSYEDEIKLGKLLEERGINDYQLSLMQKPSPETSGSDTFRSPRYSTGIPGIWEVEDNEGNRLTIVEDILELGLGGWGAIKIEKGLYKKVYRPKETEVSPEKVKLHGVIKTRWRCPECLRGTHNNYCKVHGEIEPLDLLKAPEYIKTSAIDLTFDNFFSLHPELKGETLTINDLHEQIGIEKEYAKKFLNMPSDFSEPDKIITNREEYEKIYDVKIIDTPETSGITIKNENDTSTKGITNIEIIQNWKQGKTARAPNFWTDGTNLYSYHLKIGFTGEDGQHYVYNYTNHTDKDIFGNPVKGVFKSQTTSKHVSLARRAGFAVTPPELEEPSVEEDGTYTERCLLDEVKTSGISEKNEENLLSLDEYIKKFPQISKHRLFKVWRHKDNKWGIIKSIPLRHILPITGNIDIGVDFPAPYWNKSETYYTLTAVET